MSEQPPITLDCDADGNASIKLNGVIIGVIEGTFDSIHHIEIDSEHRENGYGTIAIQKYVTEAIENDVSHIQTTAVIHPAMERILQDTLRFTPCSEDPTHYELTHGLSNDRDNTK